MSSPTDLHSPAVVSPKAVVRSWILLLSTIIFVPVIIAGAKDRPFESPTLLDLFGTYSESTKLSFGQAGYAFGHGLLIAAGGFVILRWWRLCRISGDARIYVVALMALCASFAASAALGQAPAFVPALLSWPIILGSICVLPPLEFPDLLRLLRNTLRVFTVANVLASFIIPTWTWEIGYDSPLLQQFDFRFHGLMSHANGLGPILVFTIIAELGLRRNRLSLFFIAMEAVLLVLTQSKTSLFAGFIAIPLAALFSPWPLGGINASRSLKIAFCVWFWFAAIFLTLSLDGLAAMSRTANEKISSLTGRTDIWAATISTWKDGILFGYGPKLWDEAMADRHYAALGFTVFHSHNQFLESLGHSGLVGLLSWTCLFLLYLRSAFSQPTGSGLPVLPWVAVLIVDTFSECWFNRATVATFPCLVLVTVVVVTAVRSPRPSAKRRDQASSDLSENRYFASS